MSYQSRIRDIQSAFVMGYHDRETCIEMFETLLHEFGLLPKEETLDRTITNENFLALLKMAKDHRNQATNNLPAQQQAAQQAQDHGMESNYRIADSVRGRCPVCQQPTNALFNAVKGGDNHTVPVDPPRCQQCTIKWIEEKYGAGMRSGVGPAEPATASVDRSGVTPMSADEADFFAEYEKQMAEQP